MTLFERVPDSFSHIITITLISPHVVLGHVSLVRVDKLDIVALAV